MITPLARQSDYSTGTAIFVLLITLLIYFIPALIGRNNRNASTVFLVNLLVMINLINLMLFVKKG